MQAAHHLKHTFLFEPARWEAEGTFTWSSGEILPVEGVSLVLHAGDRWFVEGKMRVLSDPPAEIANAYSVVPFPENSSATTWSSRHHALGRLSGRFIIVGDTFFSVFSSSDGCHNGSEWLRQVDPKTYEDRGVLFAQDRLLCAWAVTLLRRE